MNLQEKLVHQAKEIYPDSFDTSQDNTKGNIVPIRSEVSSPIDLVPSFAISIGEAKNRTSQLEEFIRDMMIEGIDYGLTAGSSKPSLLKSGAEKLCHIFGFSKCIEVTHRLEDWEKGVFAYEVKGILSNKRTGLIEAEGIGCCNSIEKEYKQQDPYSIANTILKMAKKRALVDAVLAATHSSGLFTQDMEDNSAGSNAPQIPSTNKLQPRESSFKLASDKQLKMISSLVSKIGMPEDTIRQLLLDKYHITARQDLSVNQASDFIKYLLALIG